VIRYPIGGHANIWLDVSQVVISYSQICILSGWIRSRWRSICRSYRWKLLSWQSHPLNSVVGIVSCCTLQIDCTRQTHNLLGSMHLGIYDCYVTTWLYGFGSSDETRTNYLLQRTGSHLVPAYYVSYMWCMHGISRLDQDDDNKAIKLIPYHKGG
jgi:hypothetical protein